MIRDAFRRKRPLPPRIQNAPELLTGLELYFEAFIELNTCRSTGWAAGPIPSWCIDEYSQRLDLDDDMADDLHYHIRMMDQAFLQYIAQKNKDST